MSRPRPTHTHSPLPHAHTPRTHTPHTHTHTHTHPANRCAFSTFRVSHRLKGRSFTTRIIDGQCAVASASASCQSPRFLNVSRQQSLKRTRLKGDRLAAASFSHSHSPPPPPHTPRKHTPHTHPHPHPLNQPSRFLNVSRQPSFQGTISYEGENSRPVCGRVRGHVLPTVALSQRFAPTIV